MCLFFFQAEDGIRDLTVTGVQTCALPICSPCLTSPVPTARCCSMRRCRTSGASRSPFSGSRACEPYDERRRRDQGSRGADRREDRESGGEGKRVDLRGRRVIKKKKKRSRV